MKFLPNPNGPTRPFEGDQRVTCLDLGRPPAPSHPNFRLDPLGAGYKSLAVRTVSIPAQVLLGPLSSRHLLAIASDNTLVEQMRRGNEAAFSVAFERHATGLLGFCRHMVSSPEDAEDAVQHTFLAASRHLARSRERELALKPWLYAIARNRCLSILRSRREQTAPPDRGLDRRSRARRGRDRVPWPAAVARRWASAREYPGRAGGLQPGRAWPGRPPADQPRLVCLTAGHPCVVCLTAVRPCLACPTAAQPCLVCSTAVRPDRNRPTAVRPCLELAPRRPSYRRTVPRWDACLLALNRPCPRHHRGYLLGPFRGSRRRTEPRLLMLVAGPWLAVGPRRGRRRGIRDLLVSPSVEAA